MSGLSRGTRVTRLRYICGKDPDEIIGVLSRLKQRVEIKGSPQWTGKQWYLWFIPGDIDKDIKSINLDEV